MRRWRAIALCLLAGAAVNVLVAWGCELAPLPPLQEVERLVEWPMPMPAGFAPRPDYNAEWRMLGRRRHVYSCAVAREPGDTLSRGYAGLTVWTCGWPAATLKRWQWFSNGTDFLDLPGAPARRYRWALHLPDSLTPRGLAKGSGWLSLRPLWPGFPLNTLFYAAILWVPLCAAGPLRRWRRGRRGLCPRCAYNLAGVAGPCPECGTPQGAAP